jgi:hypothetical protein
LASTGQSQSQSHSSWFADCRERALRAADQAKRRQCTAVDGDAWNSKAREGASPPWVQIPPLPPSTRPNARSFWTHDPAFWLVAVAARPDGVTVLAHPLSARLTRSGVGCIQAPSGSGHRHDEPSTRRSPEGEEAGGADVTELALPESVPRPCSSLYNQDLRSF